MKLSIKTKDIEIEYEDGYSMIDEEVKKRILELLDKVFDDRIQLESIKQIKNPHIIPHLDPIVGTVDEIFNIKQL